MKEQVGWRGLVERLRAEAPRYSHLIPQLPRLAHQALTQVTLPQQNDDLLRRLLAEQRRTNLLLGIAIYFGGGLLGGILLARLWLHWQHWL